MKNIYSIIAATAFLCHSLAPVAQTHTDTNYIDTNYYRYAYTPISNEYVKHFSLYDSVTGTTYDSYVNMCKDGFGYTEIETRFPAASAIDCPWFGNDTRFVTDYFEQNLPGNNMYIYGVAVLIHSIENFSPNAYIKYVACKKVGNNFERLDSVELNMNTIGVRRFMRCPVLKWAVTYDFTRHGSRTEPFDGCIDSICNVQVLELYFDQPLLMADSQFYWKVDQHIPRGWLYYTFRVQAFARRLNGYSFYANGRMYHTQFPNFPSQEFIMAITEPLPEWEHDKLEVLLQNDTEQPDPDPEESTGENSIALTGNAQWLHIYPNPAKDWLYVESDAPISGLTLCDMTGHAYHPTAAIGHLSTPPRYEKEFTCSK